MKIVLRNMTPCSLVDIVCRLGETYCPYIHSSCFYSEDGGGRFLRNICRTHMTSHPKGLSDTNVHARFQTYDCDCIVITAGVE